MTSSSGLRRGVIVKPLTGRHVVARCGCIRLRGGGSCRRAAAKKAAQSARPRCQWPVAYELLGHAGIESRRKARKCQFRCYALTHTVCGQAASLRARRLSVPIVETSGQDSRGAGFSRRSSWSRCVFVLRWLGPWKLFSRTTFDETLPRGAQTVWLGQFASRIHRTSGTVRLVTLLDGRRILRIENRHTTQGPQLRVWLSDARRAPAHCGADGSSVPRARCPGGRCPSEEMGSTSPC
jgi:hypothetical protein